jgi:ATP-dependent DNA helicase 2 subunit 2
VKEQKPDTWKKLSAPAEASPEPGNMGVVIQRSYHLNDEDETEVEKEDLAKGLFSNTSLGTVVLAGRVRNNVPKICQIL